MGNVKKYFGIGGLIVAGVAALSIGLTYGSIKAVDLLHGKTVFGKELKVVQSKTFYEKNINGNEIPEKFYRVKYVDGSVETILKSIDGKKLESILD